MQIKWHTIVIRALDLITVVVPPALPATLSIGTSFALSRLRKSGIFCIAPSRVNVSGTVNVCCFDKTGTLTEDGLEILGVRGLERNAQRFGELIDDIHVLPTVEDKASFLHALATCHSLKTVDGKAIGDPLDVKMFEFTRWTLDEGRVFGTGAIKSKGVIVEQTSLVQTVVRPPGSGQFRVEDAMKGTSKVRPDSAWSMMELNIAIACSLLRTRSDTNIRIRSIPPPYERCREKVKKQQHGDLCQGCTGSYGKYMRPRFTSVGCPGYVSCRRLTSFSSPGGLR